MATRRNLPADQQTAYRALVPVLMLITVACIGLVVMIAGLILQGNAWVNPGFGG